jgi:histidinol-phosphate/aromatic aminotransferase/cobyric acid decarboxylase-like protein
MRAFKAHLRGLSPYPYKKEEAPVKLDQNESPFDLPGALKEEALGRLRAIPWNRYPEIHAESLRKRLSALLDWPEEGIVLAPGSNLLILALSLAAEEVLDLRPSFPHYAHAAKVAGTPYRAVPLGEGFSLDLKALLAAFLKCLREKGVPGVQLATTRANRAARGLYRAMGFRVYAKRASPFWAPYLGRPLIHEVWVRDLG